MQVHNLGAPLDPQFQEPNYILPLPQRSTVDATAPETYTGSAAQKSYDPSTVHVARRCSHGLRAHADDE